MVTPSIRCGWVPGVGCSTLALCFGIALADPIQWTASSRMLGKPGLQLSDQVLCLTCAPDGKRVATGHFRNYISIWNLENGKLEQRFSTQPGFVACIAWSPDGQCLASGSNSAPSLLLWHPKSGKRVATLDRHKKRIVALSFSSDGKLLV